MDIVEKIKTLSEEDIYALLSCMYCSGAIDVYEANEHVDEDTDERVKGLVREWFCAE